MGSSASSSHNCPPQSAVPAGKMRICVAGMSLCGYAGRAHLLASEIAKNYPDTFETWFYWDGRGPFYNFIFDTFDKVPFRKTLKGHSSSPIVWIEVPTSEAGNYNSPAATEECNAMDSNNAILEVIGGCTEFKEWVRTHTAAADAAADSSTTATLSKAVPLDADEVAAKVTVCPPNAIYFPASDTALATIREGYSIFGDASHVKPAFGEQTAALA